MSKVEKISIIIRANDSFDQDLFADQYGNQCLEDLLSCSHVGACDDDVDYFCRKYNVFINPKDARSYLKGFGCWDETELKEISQKDLKEKVIWMLAGDLKEYDFWAFSTY